MKKSTLLLLGLGILIVVALVLFGVTGWPPALAQGQVSEPTQVLATQQPYAGCPRHQGGVLNAASPSGGTPGDCPMHAGEGNAGCPMQGGAGACPQHGGSGCPMQSGAGTCPQHGDAGCPMQGGAGGCPMQGQPGTGGCPMQGGSDQ